MDAARLLAALADGYGLDERGRRGLVELLVPRTLSMHALLEQGSAARRQPWARLWDEGHGRVWQADAAYTAAHLSVLQDALLDQG